MAIANLTHEWRLPQLALQTSEHELLVDLRKCLDVSLMPPLHRVVTPEMLRPLELVASEPATPMWKCERPWARRRKR